MAEIIPFRGVLYDAEKIGGYESAVAPPYDVISKDEQAALLRRHKFNVVRLILPHDMPGDNPISNKYTRAGTLLDTWLERGVLRRDVDPAIYIYRQDYEFQGRALSRIGFIALAKIEELTSGKIMAHEKTLAGPKADRLNLIRATKANLSQVFSLYSDPDGRVDELLEELAAVPPDIEFSFQSVGQKLWRVSDANAISTVAELMRDKSLFIADGHHRYETALNYRNEMRERTGVKDGNQPFDYVMMLFVNMDSEGLTILPTHRVLRNLPKINEEKFRANLSHFFDVTALESLDDLLKSMSELRGEHAMGAYIGRKSYTLLTVPDERRIELAIDGQHSQAWKLLDVTILHGLVIGRILGLKGTNMENGIRFTVDEKEAVSLVDNGGYQAAFFLNPPDVSQIRSIAKGGEAMPQKSTYFYPKPLSGLVINRLQW